MQLLSLFNVSVLYYSNIKYAFVVTVLNFSLFPFIRCEAIKYFIGLKWVRKAM